MKNAVVLICQALVVALCSYLVVNKISNSYPKSLIFIVASVLIISILSIIIFWKDLGYTKRSRQSEAMMLIVSAFTPIVSYYTMIEERLLELTNNEVVLMYVIGQVVWVLSVYICPDVVDYIRQKRY